MIKSTDIRIGNWVNELIWGNTQVSEIYAGAAVLKNTKGFSTTVSNENLNPIPLTPEIFKQCGFTEQEGEFQHPDNTDFDLMFSCSDNGLWCAYNFHLVGPSSFSIGGCDANPIGNPFKYLHQLQNIYYWLTNGTELIYTPTPNNG